MVVVRVQGNAKHADETSSSNNTQAMLRRINASSSYQVVGSVHCRTNIRRIGSQTRLVVAAGSKIDCTTFSRPRRAQSVGGATQTLSGWVC